VPKRIALVVSIRIADNRQRGVLQVVNAETRRDVSVDDVAFVLTFERDPDASFARGHIRLLPGGPRYPIHSSAALFDELSRYIAESDTPS
jgi:hypothetical protein